jgi:bacterioferritin-associated ferredoxin
MILQIVRNSLMCSLPTAEETRMYVCLCNAITDRDFRAHCEGEACTVAMVYRALGAMPQCGKCVPLVREMLRQGAQTPAAAGGDD